eukprot:3267671-Pleurochrysis_carterae.AAC.3
MIEADIRRRNKQERGEEEATERLQECAKPGQGAPGRARAWRANALPTRATRPCRRRRARAETWPWNRAARRRVPTHTHVNA